MNNGSNFTSQLSFPSMSQVLHILLFQSLPQQHFLVQIFPPLKLSSLIYYLSLNLFKLKLPLLRISRHKYY